MLLTFQVTFTQIILECDQCLSSEGAPLNPPPLFQLHSRKIGHSHVPCHGTDTLLTWMITLVRAGGDEFVQRLFFRGSELRNPRTLQDSGIYRDGQTVYLASSPQDEMGKPYSLEPFLGAAPLPRSLARLLGQVKGGDDTLNFSLLTLLFEYHTSSLESTWLMGVDIY